MRLTDEPKSLMEMKPDTSWSPRVQDVMRKALQRRREDRYESAALFGRELFMAVEAMPKGAAAGATQMIGAAEGATAIMSAPPPTRIDAAARSTPPAPPAAAPVAAPVAAAPARSRTPMFAGIGVVAVAIAAGAFFMLPKGADKTGATPPVAAGSVPAVTAPGPTVTQNPQASSGNPATVTPTGNATKSATPPKSTPGSATVADRLRVLLDLSIKDATADEARREAVTLLPKATTDDERVGLILVQAQAYAIKEDTARGCPLLRDIAEKAKLTSHASQVAFVLKSSC